MPRKSSIKNIVEGITLREFLLKCLVTNTYRKLLKEETFKNKTGIKSLGNFYNQTDKLNINIGEIYNYGISKGMIDEDDTLEIWIQKTRKNFNTSKMLSERDMYLTIAENAGLIFDFDTPKETILTTLVDFLGESKMNRLIKKFKKEQLATKK